MDRHKKLKDFLVDRKVPRADRDKIPIVLDENGDIVWVGGVEISQKAALDGVEGEEAILIRIEDL
jgi:tRNA(Ile)-lysidine synthase